MVKFAASPLAVKHDGLIGSAAMSDDTVAGIAATLREFRQEVLRRLDSIDQRLDELTAEVSLQRAALERFGFMRKRPTPPQGGGWSGAAPPEPKRE